MKKWTAEEILDKISDCEGSTLDIDWSAKEL